MTDTKLTANVVSKLQTHSREATFSAALLTEVTHRHGSGLGDRTCIALAVRVGVPILTTNRAWASLRIHGLSVDVIR